MEPADRIITRLPLTDLWDTTGPVVAIRKRPLTEADIRELLHHEPIWFMVADIGAKPLWIDQESRFTFWKTEVLPHLADSDAHIQLDDYPSEYCYIASEWRLPEGEAVVVLQRYH